MKRHATIAWSIAIAVFLAIGVLASPSRAANPAGNGGDAAAAPDAAQEAGDGADAAAEEPPEGIQPTTTPDNFGCNMHASRTGSSSGSLLLGLSLLGALGIVMRKRRRALVIVAAAATWSLPSSAQPAAQGTAQPPAQGTEQGSANGNASASTPPSSSDATTDEGTLGAPRGEHRWLTLSYNPFTLQASRYGANAELLVASHHVIAGTLYWANTLTNEDSFNNRFRGIGGELGYRYYTGHDGPRGIFLGPSLLLGSFEAIPARGASTSFENYGLALDVGYQALVADRWVVGIGGGLQYNRPDKTFPQQELPASVYANPGVRPRLLLALGVAF